MISSVHPHDARTSELRLLAVTLVLGIALIYFILWLGVGQPTYSVIPGVSVWEVFMSRLPKIALFAIPSAVTVAIGLSAVVTNSTFYEGWFGRNGYTPGETAFTMLGIWIGAAWAMSFNPSDQWSMSAESVQLMYTRQEMTCFGSGLGAVISGLIAIFTRGLR